MFPHIFPPFPVSVAMTETIPKGQTVPYACISSRSVGCTYCGRSFNVGHEFVFSLSAAAYTAAQFDPRVRGKVAPGGLAACVDCCDAVAREIERERLSISG